MESRLDPNPLSLKMWPLVWWASKCCFFKGFGALLTESVIRRMVIWSTLVANFSSFIRAALRFVTPNSPVSLPSATTYNKAKNHKHCFIVRFMCQAGVYNLLDNTISGPVESGKLLFLLACIENKRQCLEGFCQRHFLVALYSSIWIALKISKGILLTFIFEFDLQSLNQDVRTCVSLELMLRFDG